MRKTKIDLDTGVTPQQPKISVAQEEIENLQA